MLHSKEIVADEVRIAPPAGHRDGMICYLLCSGSWGRHRTMMLTSSGGRPRVMACWGKQMTTRRTTMKSSGWMRTCLSALQPTHLLQQVSWLSMPFYAPAETP